MASSEAVTDLRKLPSACVCGTGATYDERLRIRRNCLNAAVTYDISSIQVSNGGGSYRANDVLQFNDGFPNAQSANLVVSSVSTGAITGITVTGTYAYTTVPTGTLIRNVRTTSNSATGARFTVVWKKNTTGCCSCGS